MKTALLFSGGWDSIACFYKTEHLDPDLLFFNYNQIYAQKELDSAVLFARFFEIPLRIQKLELVHDQERRNFFLIAEAKRLGYQRVIVGSRNLIPLFDKYKDSNWSSLKLFGKMMNVEIVLPVTGWSKRKIVRVVQERWAYRPYNCYSNGNNFDTCACPNCAELRKLL